MSTSNIQVKKMQLEIARNLSLPGVLNLVKNSNSLVIFVHGSGSSHLSPRNQLVANIINEHGISTFLCDLLTRTEEAEDAYTAHLRFNIDFLTERVNAIITKLLLQEKHLQNMVLGTFGASTGGAAAIRVAIDRNDIKAVVSRGGRPDLVDKQLLQKLTVPTLLLVGGNDREVIKMNASAYEHMALLSSNQKQLMIIPGATHLFAEPGTLEAVAIETSEWFNTFLKLKEQQQQQPGTTAIEEPGYQKTESEIKTQEESTRSEM